MFGKCSIRRQRFGKVCRPAFNPRDERFEILGYARGRSRPVQCLDCDRTEPFPGSAAKPTERAQRNHGLGQLLNIKFFHTLRFPDHFNLKISGQYGVSLQPLFVIVKTLPQ